jgi:hypothetical protein
MRTNPLLHRGIAVVVIALLIALAFAPSINADVSKASANSNENNHYMIAILTFARINGTITNISQWFNLFNKVIIGFHAEIIYLKGKTIRGEFELIPGRFWYDFWTNIIIKEFTEIDSNMWYIDAIAIPFTWQTWPN